MEDELITNAVDQLLHERCSPAVVRQIEQGGGAADLWRQLRESGFADALVPEALGGSGLPLSAMYGLFERCGAHAVPVPFAETTLARASLAQLKVVTPEGSITLAQGHRDSDGGIVAGVVPCGRTSDHVLVSHERGWLLLLSTTARHLQVGFVLDETMRWDARVAADAVCGGDDSLDVRTLQACIYAAQLAGALGRVFEMTLRYANERTQFSRPISQFQAVQHHLAVMAEHVAAARMAARIGCMSESWRPNRLRTAIAKARTSEAALEVANLGHSIHGAIGFTEELDLQLFTRRLHAWRQAGGAEAAWHDVAGRELLASQSGMSLDLLREVLDKNPGASTLQERE